jgi:hypothetical protein
VYTNNISSLKLRVIVVHAFRPTTRQTTFDFVSSFARHLPNCDVQYLNIFHPKNEDWKNLSPDIVIVNYDVLNYRFSPLWKYLKNELLELGKNSRFRILLAQDDFWANELLDDWIIENKVDRVLTPIENNLEVLYPRSINGREFRTVLTGYVNPSQANRFKPKQFKDRTIDLGQRVRYPGANLGKYGQEKARVAERLASLTKASGFVTDVSTDVNDSKSGQSWIDFLCDTRFTVSMKGGASLNDPKGLLYLRTANFVARNPSASYEEIQENCLKGVNEDYVFSAISPRLFEAAQARTCQILVESDYLGVLEPWVHYIPLKSDFSNSSEVLDAMRDHEQAEQIADNCYEVLIASNSFTDKCLIDAALTDLPEIKSDTGVSSNEAWIKLREHLHDLSFVQENCSPELSDTLILWLHDKWMRGGRSELISLKKVISAPNSINCENAADSFLTATIRYHSIEAWVVRRIDETNNSQAFSRLVWPWRQLPTELTIESK